MSISGGHTSGLDLAEVLLAETIDLPDLFRSHALRSERAIEAYYPLAVPEYRF